MLSVELAEAAVFLRRSSDLTASGRRRYAAIEGTPAVVRGTVTLKLSKRTRIKQLEVFLEGNVVTKWPEGSLSCSPSSRERAEGRCCFRYRSKTHANLRNHDRAVV